MKKEYTKPTSAAVNIVIESSLLSASNPSLHNEVGDSEEYSNKKNWKNTIWD